ncbi:hypothetical protein AGR56_09700 [Clostridium sp. DMHC 10]|uniref:alpha-amylase family glycosyl hydrolase n=1 Tax=Clostridium sp. DMHC 10 TaxID=747377 RepID=UPI00069F2415|nr:alpha-amylase family glycosyl hydrolase [Clostridium sp. DMHC 10]KOF56888.1 hypothetical protein AGR56_09700 [Clostridium sp. DMHC 10]
MGNKLKLVFIILITSILSFSLNNKVNAANKSTKITSDDMIYFIMTDRFCDGDKSNNYEVDTSNPSKYHGGDFQGIINKLDYIKNLGFTTIWITPVVKNDTDGYHGYWATDFYKTNEHFGSMAKLKELVNKAHQKGLKVIFDIVVNHTGVNHPFVKDPKKASWFHENTPISDFNNQDNVENGWLSGLPDLDQNNLEVKNYLINMAKWWIKETNIDGYRLDTVRHVPKSFWKDFTSSIKKDYPNFYFIGEVNNGSSAYIQSYEETGIDGFVNFPAYYTINSVFKGLKPASDLANSIDQDDIYTNRNLMGTFVDNHDVPRFINDVTDLKNERLEGAITFMMTYTGIPVMYYGTEIGMDGGNDPDNRRMMDWNSKSSITKYVKKLTSIRKANPALTKGNIEVLSSSDNTICYLRKYNNNIVIAAFNTSDKPQEISFDLPKDDYNFLDSLKDLLSEKSYKISKGKVSFTIKPMQSSVLTLKSNLIYLCTAAAASIIIIFVVTIVILKKIAKQ